MGTLKGCGLILGLCVYVNVCMSGQVGMSVYISMHTWAHLYADRSKYVYICMYVSEASIVGVHATPCTQPMHGHVCSSVCA